MGCEAEYVLEVAPLEVGRHLLDHEAEILGAQEPDHTARGGSVVSIIIIIIIIIKERNKSKLSKSATNYCVKLNTF